MTQATPHTNNQGYNDGWAVYQPEFDNPAHDADLGGGQINGTYLVNGKNCKVAIGVFWGEDSTAGSGGILVPMPPGCVPDFDRMLNLDVGLGPTPFVNAIASGQLAGSPIAISADFAQVFGFFVTLANFGALEAGDLALIQADIPIL